jgi:hypothetical protein
MSNKWSRGMLLARFKEYLAMGMDWRKAAKRAGYAEKTIEIQGARIRRLAKYVLPKKTKQLVRVAESKGPEWSPVSGQTFTPSVPPDRGKPAVEAKPSEPSRFESERIFHHPELGEVVRSKAGGFIPTWAREEFGVPYVNLSSLPGPFDHTPGAWARMYSAQDQLACSYSVKPRPLPPPMVYTEQREEELPHGTIRYKDEGADVTGDALAGKFGFARLGVQGT